MRGLVRPRPWRWASRLGIEGGARTSGLVPAFAFAGALLGVFLAYGLGAAGARVRTPTTLLLAGVAVVSFLTAIQTYILQRNVETIREVYTFILGSLATSGWSEVRLALPYAAVAAVVVLAHRRELDVFSVGDEEAASLGLHPQRSRLLLLIAASLGTAAAVAVSGLIGFVGIIVPHMIRLIAGTSYRLILPLSMFFGGAFLVLSDLLGADDPAADRGADRRRHRLPRRAVLRTRAPDREAGRAVTGAIGVSALRVSLGGAPVLLGVDLTVAPGEWVTVIGPNGAGKSTLLRAVGGLLPHTGEVRAARHTGRAARPARARAAGRHRAADADGAARNGRARLRPARPHAVHQALGP